MKKRVLVLPGDGIGPEIVEEAMKVLHALVAKGELLVEFEYGCIGGAALDAMGAPLPAETLALARNADAILLGSIGGPKWDTVERALRPETGLLQLRAALGVFANLRPVILYPPLLPASTLRSDIVSGLNLLIVRELTGGIYFGTPRGLRLTSDGDREAFNTLVYKESEIARICRVAFEVAEQRDRRVCSVDKANVLEVSQLWREVAERVARDYPTVSLSHMYIDNAAMQLVLAPKQFDVIVTSNLFGDILSDEAAMLTGSIGMLPSASLDGAGRGIYEPAHGSAPDIAGKQVANPLATILSVAMMLRYSLGAPALARRIETAVGRVLERGLRTLDIAMPGTERVRTAQMGDAVLTAL